METREQWLAEAVIKFRPYFTVRKYDIPDKIQVSCGFPSKSPLKSLGQCWSPTCTFDGTIQIFISPTHKTAVEVLGTLMHELTHAALPDDAKHGPLFREAMAVLGLEGKAKHASPSLETMPMIEQMAADLGDYPNQPIIPQPPKERQTSKKSFALHCEHKRQCDNRCQMLDKGVGEDYSVTMGVKKLIKFGVPLCPCGHEMVFEEDDFKLFQQIMDETANQDDDHKIKVIQQLTELIASKG